MSEINEWHEQRRTGIGGSDAAAALGVSPYKTPYQLYLEKRDDISQPDLSDNESVYWGTVLENVVAQEYSKRTGHQVQRCNVIIRHPEHSFMLANVDRLVWQGRKRPFVRGKVRTDRLLECKTTSAYASRAEWGDESSDAVPIHYLIQCMHYLAVTGCQVADIAVLIGGQRYRQYEIQRDNALITMMIDRERAFWRCVENGEPPPPANAADIALMYPEDNGDLLTADEKTLNVLGGLKAVKEQIKALENQKRVYEEAVKLTIGNNSGLTDNRGQVLATWKAQQTKRLDTKTLQNEHPDLYQLYTNTTETRVLRIK